jgi:MFS family permease
MQKERLIPLIVACAWFMENMDSTVIATSLPAIAADIGTSPLTLKLAITSYLLSLAVFIPASGWTADRFGARAVFSVAIFVFMIGSICCALSTSITDFVIARIIQGLGGAMMIPVGRLVILRSIDKSALVNAMAWVTMPALIGPVIGPPLGGFITTYFSWHWIFLINIPIGLLGIWLALKYIDPIKSENPERFDFVGLVLAGLGVAGLAFGLSVAGLGLLPWQIVLALIVGGSIAMGLYLSHAKRTASPVLDFSLIKHPTLRASLTGGFMYRLGIGALPFLLPLLMQIGFGLSPFKSGLVTFASAVGAIFMKALAAQDPHLRLPQHPDHQRGGEFVLPRGLCSVHTNNAIAVDHDHPDCGRILPLAAVHGDQHHGLRGGDARRDEPRDNARQRQPAACDFGRRRGRRIRGRSHDDGKSFNRAERERFLARLHRGRHSVGALGHLVLEIAGRCGPRDFRPPHSGNRNTSGRGSCRGGINPRCARPEAGVKHSRPSFRRDYASTRVFSPRNPSAITYRSDESCRLAAGFTCFTLVKSRLSCASRSASAPP